MTCSDDDRTDERYKSRAFAHVWIGGMALAVFAAVSVLVEYGKTESFDAGALRQARSMMDTLAFINPERLEEIIRDLTALGGYAVLVILVTGMIWYLALSDHLHMVRFLLASVLGGLVLMLVLKESFDRSRPNVVEHKSNVSSTSFPSGHSMMSMVVYLSLGTLLARISKSRALKLYSLGMPVLVSVLVGVSRIFVGVHYPTDVLAGWAAGIFWVSLVCLATERLERKGIVRFGGSE